jgi:putative transposase
MRYSQSEKMEIIRLVEESKLSVRRTLEELDVNRSSFYVWYRNYLEYGYDGLASKKKGPKRFWNKIPEMEKQMIVAKALEMPEKTPRELAWYITDNECYYISESSVYRILKSYDLITSPAFVVISASDKFKHPTKYVNELWQTDFTYFKITGWGWYYLASVLDDYSRYIVSWKLFTTMTSDDVKEVLDMAIDATGADKVKVKIRPRLLTDNGPCYLSEDLRAYLDQKGMVHSKGAPFHPQTQGKIERYHRSMKSVILLDNYYLPGDLEREIDKYIEYYNNERYHEGINNMKPVDVYNGKSKEIETYRSRIKKETLGYRKLQNLNYLYCA